MLNPHTIYIIIALVILAIATRLIRRYMESAGLRDKLEENAAKQPSSQSADCSACDGSDSRCEQECMMEAMTKDIVYFDDEELDKYALRPSDKYADEEVEDFREVLYSMRQEEVKEWNRSLILRHINVPDQMKDELVMMMEEVQSAECRVQSDTAQPHSTFNFQLSTLFFLLLFLSSCSTKKNTGMTRAWHSFTAKYNTYYNGSLAYIDGALEKENGNKDNYTEMIPLYTVGNKASRDIGKGNFDRAIEKSQKAIKRHSIRKRPTWTKNRSKTEKDIEWLNRKEYNPFLWKAWLMMGKSQFMKGDFDEAASTFAYMSRMYSTQPAIYGKARAWLARCYTEHDWLYDAEDVIKKMQRDSIHWKAQKDWNYALADYYVRSQRFEEAIPYLQKVIKRESRRKQKAREYFLLGQIYATLNQKDNAYRAYRSCVRCSPPYELAFNARIAMTEVAAEKDAKGMIRLLRRMARNDNNKDYLDQVYYAIGNIYLAQRDTLNAIDAYEKGNSKATRSGIEKGVLLLKLGDIYWTLERYSDAQRCYGAAIGLLDKDRKDYEQLAKRSKILDELAPHTDAIHLNDSLLALSTMPEADRNAAIDRVIEALKKKEKEERDKLAEQEAEKRGQNQQNNNRPQQNQNQQGFNNQQSSTFYFYNPQAVNQGKEQFRKVWGQRQNTDDWQRMNKTVVSQDPFAGDSTLNLDNLTEEQKDSIAKVEQRQDSIDNALENPENDPHKREYYLKQIPFEQEQKDECHRLIADGLYNSAVIFKDKFDNLPLSEKQFTRLQNDYPDHEKNPDIFYHCYLLYNRLNQELTADTYLQRLKDGFPDHEWTKILSDPYFKENAIYGTHLEDSLYAATYSAFKANDFSEIYANYGVSESRFPLGDNRDKFIFIHGLSKLNDGDAETCLSDMQNVVDKYPKSSVQPLAGMIINGVKAGRRLHGGRFDMGDVWSRRTMVMADSDSIAARKFVADLEVPYTFLFAYNPDSLENENQLLFELARFNFTTFIVRNFSIEVENVDGLNRMKVSGFQSYQEARQYARQLYEQSARIPTLAAKARPIIISDQNLELLGTQFSYNDYDKFYETHYVSLKLSTLQLLTEPVIEKKTLDDVEEPDAPEAEQPAQDAENTQQDGLDVIAIPDETENKNVGNEGNEINVTNVNENPNTSNGNANETEVNVVTNVKQNTPANNTQQDDGINVVTEEAPAKNNQQDDGFNIVTDEAPANNTQQDDGFNVVTDEAPANNTQQDDGFEIVTDEGTSTGQDDEIIVQFDDEEPANNNSADEPVIETETDNNNNNKEPAKKDATELENDFFEIEDF